MSATFRWTWPMSTRGSIAVVVLAASTARSLASAVAWTAQHVGAASTYRFRSAPDPLGDLIALGGTNARRGLSVSGATAATRIQAPQALRVRLWSPRADRALYQPDSGLCQGRGNPFHLRSRDSWNAPFRVNAPEDQQSLTRARCLSGDASEHQCGKARLEPDTGDAEADE